MQLLLCPDDSHQVHAQIAGAMAIRPTAERARRESAADADDQQTLTPTAATEPEPTQASEVSALLTCQPPRVKNLEASWHGIAVCSDASSGIGSAKCTLLLIQSSQVIVVAAGLHTSERRVLLTEAKQLAFSVQQLSSVKDEV